MASAEDRCDNRDIRQMAAACRGVVADKDVSRGQVGRLRYSGWAEAIRVTVLATNHFNLVSNSLLHGAKVNGDVRRIAGQATIWRKEGAAEVESLLHVRNEDESAKQAYSSSSRCNRP